jgi:hypothetical protein
MKIATGKEYLLWYKLEKGESIFDVLGHSGVSLDTIWDYHRNKKLREKRKSPFWVAAHDEVCVPKKKAKEDLRFSENLYVYTTESYHIPIIDVYLGFMDEEVNARLERLIDSQQGRGDAARPVILIERGKLQLDEPILEWQIGNYGLEPRSIVHVSPKGVKNDTQSKEPERILARAMGVMMEYDLASDLDWLARGLKVKRYFDLMKFLQHRGRPWTKSKLPKDATGEGPWLSVARFDVGKNKNAPIIVIRTPEMGLQPSLMSPYLAFLFKAISAMASQLAAEQASKAVKTKTKDRKQKWKIWEWPLRVSQFGAQGSSSEVEKYRPGNVVSVIGSLFVGVEIASDVTVTAKDNRPGGATLKATFKHSKDSTDAAPHRKARDADKHYADWEKDQVKERGYDSTRAIEKGKSLPKEAYHEYEVSGSKADLTAYAVVSLCTPAGVYDFLRKEISGAQDVRSLIKQYDLTGRLLESMLRDAEDTAQAYPLKSTQTPAQHDKAVAERRKGREVLGLRDKEYDDLQKYSETLTSDADKIEAAQLVAGAMFRWNSDALKVQEIKLAKGSPFCEMEKTSEHAVTKHMKLKDVLDNVPKMYNKYYSNGEISLTGSYFIGEDDKEVADELGIHGVNMEDYHVLRVLRSAIAKGVSEESDYPMIMQWRVDRINCDPKKLDARVLGKFNEYIKTRTLTVDEYVEVIQWGLRGVLKEEVPKCAHWGLVETIRKTLGKLVLLQHLWSFVPKKDWGEKLEGFIVPDPFCIEIATDFVAELAKMKPWESEPGGIAKIDSAILDKVCAVAESDATPAKKALGMLKEEIKDNEAKEYDLRQRCRRHENKDVKTWYEQITELQKRARAVLSAEDPKKAAEELMQYVSVWCGFDAGKGRLKTWLRPGKKWAGVTAPTLQDVGRKPYENEKFGGAAVDRAFYKSCNMMALQCMAHEYFFGEKGKPRK